MVRTLFLLSAVLLPACRTDNSIKIFNAEPTAEITSHSDGDEVLEGYTEIFRGGVGDPDHSDGDLTATWSIDILAPYISALGGDGQLVGALSE